MNVVKLALGLLSGLALACPEYGVELTGTSVPGYVLRTTGSAVRLSSTDERKGYHVYFDATLRGGVWCVSDWLVGEDQIEKCQRVAGEGRDIKDEQGRVVARLTMHTSPSRIEGTAEQGAVLYLMVLRNGVGLMPYYRFVYTHSTSGGRYAESTQEALEKKLESQGITYENNTVKLHHRMYADLYQPGFLLGTAVVEKTSVPFVRARGNNALFTDSANLNGKHWKTAADSAGCHTKVEEIRK